MNIALVTETYPPEVNGVAMTLSRLVAGLRQRDHDVRVYRPRQGSEDRPEETDAEGAPIERTLPGFPLPGYPGLQFGLPAGATLKRFWNDWKPDFIHVATEGPLGFSASQVGLGLQIPVVSSFHTNFHNYGSHYGFGLLKEPGLAYLRWFHNRTARTFVPSESVRDALAEHDFENLRLMSRGVDTVLFDPARRDPGLRESWGVSPDDPVAIYVGRLAPEKNLPLVLKTFGQLREADPRWKLVLVGDGPSRAELEKKGDPGIILAGMQRDEDLARHYASGDCFLFGSVTETFGNVVTEAMASGLVVLAYDYAAGRKHIRSDENGFTVAVDDETAFINQALSAAEASATWPEIRAQARTTMLPVSWDAVVDAYLEEVGTVIPASD